MFGINLYQVSSASSCALISEVRIECESSTAAYGSVHENA